MALLLRDNTENNQVKKRTHFLIWGFFGFLLKVSFCSSFFLISSDSRSPVINLLSSFLDFRGGLTSVSDGCLST